MKLLLNFIFTPVCCSYPKNWYVTCPNVANSIAASSRVHDQNFAWKRGCWEI